MEDCLTLQNNADTHAPRRIRTARPLVSSGPWPNIPQTTRPVCSANFQPSNQIIDKVRKSEYRMAVLSSSNLFENK